MPRFIARIARARCMLLLGGVLLGAPVLSSAADDLAEALRRCSLIDVSSERLECYDDLSREHAPEQGETSAAPKSPPSGFSASSPEKSLDDLGAETLPGKTGDDEEELEVRARVTGCQKDYRKRYHFVFDNGQVWKQSNDKRLYLRDCNFDVTITKDFFGYKMQQDGEKSRIRISRVK